MPINLYAAWIGLLCGCFAGAVPGLFFHKDDWLDGYSSWRRRMIRLAHISFFGIGLINLAFSLTVRTLQIDGRVALPSVLFITAAVAMPLVCYASAIKEPFRHLFFIPATSLTLGVAVFLWRMLYQ